MRFLCLEIAKLVPPATPTLTPDAAAYGIRIPLAPFVAAQVVSATGCGGCLDLTPLMSARDRMWPPIIELSVERLDCDESVFVVVVVVEPRKFDAFQRKSGHFFGFFGAPSRPCCCFV